MNVNRMPGAQVKVMVSAPGPLFRRGSAASGRSRGSSGTHAPESAKRGDIMSSSRPFGVALLAALALLAAIICAITALQFLHILPITVGPLAFFGFDLLGAVISILLALIYLWVARMLWELEPQGWLFVVILASINLIFDIVAIFGASSFQGLSGSFLVNALILVYCLWPATRAAFKHA
jgi:hypothetical protein